MGALLVTGGAGFIGSNFIHYMTARYPELPLVCLDSLTYAGNPANLDGISESANFRFIQGDIRDADTVWKVFCDFGIDRVVNFAAESHVDRAISHPGIFVSTNVLGTEVLLDAALRSWSTGLHSHCATSFREGVKFMQISTDEVYGSLAPESRANTEASPLKPNNPYSASKAGADMLVRSYHKTYGLPVSITRSCNNYGPRQHPEKLIPLMIKNCLSGTALPVYGDGNQRRDWLYVTDHCAAIDAVLRCGRDGEIYNIGGGDERTNLSIIADILRATGMDDSLIEHVEDRPGHDVRYSLDCSKIETELAWKPEIPLSVGLARTIEWYVKYR